MTVLAMGVTVSQAVPVRFSARNYGGAAAPPAYNSYTPSPPSNANTYGSPPPAPVGGSTPPVASAPAPVASAPSSPPPQAPQLPSNSTGNLGQCNPVGNNAGIDAGQGAPAALYWMTNEPDGNFIMSASIDSEGQLTFGDKYWTGGVGAHGVTEPPESPDPLFSQASVKVVGKTLVVVNAGSNTATMFNIDETNPALLTMAGGPMWSGGEFPVSSTIDKVTGNVCVINGGAMNSVNCYTQDPTRGLTAIPNTMRLLGLNQTTPPSGPANTASQILFADDGKRLFASVKGQPDAPGFIAAWTVADDGSLSQDFERNVPADGGALPFSMTLVRGADAILNTDPALGFSVYEFDGTKATSDKGVVIEGQGAACWSEFSDVTKNYYITDIMTSQLTEVEVNTETLESTIVKQYPQPEGSSTIDNEIVTVGQKDFIYIMSPGTMRIEALALVGPGDAQPIQSFDIAAAAQIAGITVSTPNLQGVNAFFAPLA